MRSDAEVVENAGGDRGIGDEREDAEMITATQWVTWSPNTLRNSAAQSSLRASMIAVGAGIVVAVGEGTMRERQR